MELISWFLDSEWIWYEFPKFEIDLNYPENEKILWNSEAGVGPILDLATKLGRYVVTRRAPPAGPAQSAWSAGHA
jgi:hypothetical protein